MASDHREVDGFPAISTLHSYLLPGVKSEHDLGGVPSICEVPCCSVVAITLIRFRGGMMIDLLLVLVLLLPTFHVLITTVASPAGAPQTLVRRGVRFTSLSQASKFKWSFFLERRGVSRSLYS